MVSPNQLPSVSEGHYGLPTPVKDEQDSSYAKMEDTDKPDQSSMSSSKKRGYDTMVHDKVEGLVRYDPSREPPPKTPLFHQSFFLAENIALRIPVEILDIIKESGCSGEGVEYIRDHAKLAKIIDSPGDVIVGLTGDSGTGKSSVINSLLGIDDIAPSGNEGEACTAVVQEFRKPRQSQGSPYESEIIFFEPVSRNKALRSWVTDFWDSEEANADLSDNTFLDDEDGASTAATALFALFCDHAECEDIDKTQDFLRKAKVRGDPVILAKLISWTENLLKRHAVCGDRVTIGSHTPDGLQERISIYMRHEKRNGKWSPSPWPLVKIIRTFLHAPLLAQGIVLADLPGSSDTNQTRRRAAKQYSRMIEYTIVVSNIARAQTDSATQKYLVDAFKRRRGPSVCMVATHSDSIRTTEAYIKACIKGASPDDANDLTMFRNQCDETKSRLDIIKQEMAQARKRKDVDAKELLEEEMKDLKLEKVTLQAKISERCIEMRNQKVAEAINKKYSPLMRGTNRLPVFCVSNVVYMKHIRGYEPTTQPRIGAHATGIPRLQSNLLCLPARRKYESFKDYRQIKLPSLLNSIKIAFSDGWLKEKEDLQHIILAAQDSIAEEIGSVFLRLLENDLLVVIDKIKTNKTNYVEPAQSRLAYWTTEWHPSTYKAFTKRSGNHETKSVGSHDWNCEILGALVKDLEKDTRSWDNSSIQLTEDLSNGAEQRVNTLVKKLEAEAQSRREVLQPFFDELHLQRDHLKARCKTVAETFERELIILKDCILTTEDIHESFFVQAMQKAYDECASIVGTGSHKRRWDVLKQHVSNVAKGPFQQVHDKAKAEARKLTKKHAKRLSDQFLRTFQNFHKTFMLGFQTEEYDPPDAKALRTRIQSKVPALKTKLLEIDSHLAECEEFESQ